MTLRVKKCAFGLAVCPDTLRFMRMSVKSALLGAVALSATVSCSGDFNTSRPPTQKTTLGDDMYSTLCDRVGASVLAEDLSGASYHALCHMAPNGTYANKVDESPAALPPVAGNAVLPRKYAVAKLEAMARRRKDLIQAFNATFDDGDVPIPFDSSGRTIKGHAALTAFLQAIVPLYEHNSVEPKSEPMMPGLTRATGRLFAALAGPGDSPYTDFAKNSGTRKQANQDMGKIAGAAQGAMASIAGRQGYRPLRVALGAIRPALAYPGLREMAQTLVPELGPGGSMHDQLQNVLGAIQQDLATVVDNPQSPTPYQLVDPTKLQPNRARTDMEVLRAILLSEDPAFAASGAQPQYLVRRDLRGFALPAPGQSVIGVDAYGRARVDGLGRFLAAGGSGLAKVDTPFLVPDFTRVGTPDAFGRALVNGQLVYRYIDTSQTFGASAMRDLVPLLDPDPTNKHETVTDLLAGAYRLFGDQSKETGAWGSDYQKFNGATSPWTDLIYAAGWMFADKDSDATLTMFKELATKHEQVLARVIGAALEVRKISNKYPNVKLDPSDTFWDEMAEEVVKIAKDPALFKDVLRALENPDVQQYAGKAFGNYSAYRDALTYDPNNLNGAPLNLTDGGNSHADPHNPVDYSKPDTGVARSEFHRILQIIHDVDGVNACNKAGAKVSMKLLGFNISWPLIGSYKECELFVFQNMGVVYLDSILGKGKLQIRAGGLNTLINIGSTLGLNPDQLLEQASGITGMTQTPTPAAFNRLVFFGADGGKYGTMPDLDTYVAGKNANTNKFISGLIDPLSTVGCPTRTVQDPQGQLGPLQLADCSLPGGSKNDLSRIRDHGTIFTWEKFNFYKAMRPLLKAFDDHNASPLFLELMETLYRHWPSAQHSQAECTHTGTWIKGQPGYNPKYCAESGLSHYEPILAQAFKTDLIPALGALVKTIDGMTVQDPRNGTSHQGLDLLRYTTRVLFDPAYAAEVHMVDRGGKAATTWADGKTPKPQLTLFDLFAQAMREIDQKLVGGPRLQRWHSGRSQLVDQFLSVDGTKTNAAFHNKAVPKAMPILIDVLRAQINANCPHRETASTACNWAVGNKKLPGDQNKPITRAVIDTFNSPVFATTMNLLDKMNQDPKSRRELEKLLHYLLEQGSGNNALHATMTSLSDMMQLLSDDVNMQPIYNAVSLAAAPASDTVPIPGCQPTQSNDCRKPTPGATDRVLEALQTLTAEPNGQKNPYDQYRILDRILKNLVTPMDPNNPQSMTPIEVFLDTVAEVNRVDASAPVDEPLTAQDYAYVFGTVRDFLTSNRRGLEQFYEIIKHRDGN